MRRVAFCLAIAAVVFLCYEAVLHNGFTGYDDPEYVTANPHVSTGLNRTNITWALTAWHSSNWHPLTWMSHALDCSLFGLNPAGHHFTNLLLHQLNCVLLFLWLDLLTGFRWRSALVALAFGLHPLHVESVAWVAERKDVLSAFFWLLTLLAYTAYTRRPGVWRYMLVAGLFVAGLMSKPMVVTLPAVLLLVDWWSGRGIRIREKLPLAALAAASSAVTFLVHEQSGSVPAMDAFPLPLRLANAVVAYVRYLWKTLYPVDLAVFYPMPAAVAPWVVLLAAIMLAAITWLAFAMRRKHPALLFGWLWYGITLVPVIGIIQTGMQSMADRYMYLPMIGLLIAATWELVRFRFAAPVVLLLWGVLTWRQIPVWHDGVTLFSHALEVTENNFVAHDNLGIEFDRRGRAEEALVHYREAVRIRPGDRNSESNYAQATFALGEKRYQQGRLDDALAQFREGLSHAKRNAMAHTYTGLILMRQNQLAMALSEFRLAIAIDPKLSRAHIGLGVALAQSGDLPAAKGSFQEALRIDPGNAEARFDLDLIERATGAGRKR